MFRSTLSNWREYLTPISHTSTFETTGQLTPEEFVKAGDYLVRMFPTWKWNEDEFKDLSCRDFLPSEKQFLVTRKVPSSRRATNFLKIDDTETKELDDGWILNQKYENEENTSTSGDIEKVSNPSVPELVDLSLEENYGEEMNHEVDDELTQNEMDDDIVDIQPSTVRYYDIYITYSTSYRVPKLYLCGFDNDGSPLAPEQMFEDIAPDYRTKTATIEPLPFFKGNQVSVSIHPCKHANVMRVLMDKVRASRIKERSHTPKGAEEEWEDLEADIEEGLRVDQYLIVFLKFITSVTPGIEHDYTMEGW